MDEQKQKLINFANAFQTWVADTLNSDGPSCVDVMNDQEYQGLINLSALCVEALKNV